MSEVKSAAAASKWGKEIAKAMSEEKEILNTRDLEKLLGMSYATIFRLRKYGDLPYIRLGRLVRFKKSAILEWLEGHKKTGRQHHDVMMPPTTTRPYAADS